MKKRIIKYIILFILVLGLFFVIYKITKKDNNLLGKKIKIGDVTFSDDEDYKKDDNYIFRANVKSKKDEINIESVDVYLKDENGKLIAILSSYIGGLKKNETKKITIDSTIDILGAYSVNYTVNRK